MKKMTIHKASCLRCGHSWVPRQEEIRRCASCKSVYWNVPRRKAKPVEEASHA